VLGTLLSDVWHNDYSNLVQGAYGDVHYYGIELPETVSIGDASQHVSTAGPTDVTAVIGSYGPPKNWFDDLLSAHIDFGSVGDFYPGTDGILGIGPNAFGPVYVVGDHAAVPDAL